MDDGIATGATARAACQVARAHGAVRVVLAVPVAPAAALAALAEVADEVVCLEAPTHFVAVGEWYRDFVPVDRDEVLELLRESASGSGSWPVAVRSWRARRGAGAHCEKWPTGWPPRRARAAQGIVSSPTEREQPRQPTGTAVWPPCLCRPTSAHFSSIC